MGDDLIQQIGLLLTQMRYARRALEDIERSTARYGGFAFAAALSEGPRFGTPPMLGDALKVHVVNINDLAPGGGIGTFLVGLLGGIGRLFGGLFGGLIGGTISGVTLPLMVYWIQRLAGSVERIVGMLGVPKEPAPGEPKSNEPSGVSFFDKLDEIKGIVDSFTALFQAAGGDPDKAAQTKNPMTPEGERWLAIVRTADSLVRGIALVVKGLTLLIPEIIGALAMLLARLDSIKLAVVDLLQFLLREALLLRGVVLTVLFDTLAAAAKLAANVLGILGVTLQDVISSVFKAFNSVLDAALAAIEFLAGGLARTIDALLKWLVETVVTTLSVIGDTRVFRVVVYALQNLPYVLPSLVQLVRGTTISGTDQKALDEAKKFKVEGPTLVGPAAAKLPPLTSVATTLLDKDSVDALKGAVKKAEGSLTTLMGDVFNDTSKGMQRLGSQLEGAASDRLFNEALDKHIGTLRKRSDDLAGALDKGREAAETAAKNRPDTGLERIAKAYEDWLGSPVGLKSLLGKITEFIRETPTSGPGGENSLAAKAIGPTTIDRPRATVEIDDLVIELMPPPDRDLPGGVPGVMKALSDHSPEEFLNAIVELMHEMDQRGMTFGHGSMLFKA